MEPKFNVICFSNQLWDYPNWTNKRQVMYRLSQKGHKVIFVDPTINFGRVLLTQFKKGFFSILRLLLGYKKEDNLLVYTPIKYLPLEKFYAKFFCYQINKLAKKYLDPEAKTVMWVYNVELPELQIYLDNVKRDFLLYDCVDYYAGFPRYQTKEQKEAILSIEKNLTQVSDLIFATAPGLVDRLKKYNSKTFYTPNVGDFELFHGSVLRYKNDVPEKLKNISHPIIGYIGATDTYKFDYNLLKEAALKLPNYSFVIIGGSGLKDTESSLSELGLENISNIHFIGTVPFVESPKYMANFDVDLIPYVLNDYTIGGCFPVKFFNSMAAGIPSVVTDMPVFTLYKDITYISKTYEEFIINITKALEENSEKKITERVGIAKQNTYELKVASMLSLIKSHLR
jgi:glycosyltransferase involved in cell wall biosynthesis